MEKVHRKKKRLKFRSYPSFLRIDWIKRKSLFLRMERASIISQCQFYLNSSRDKKRRKQSVSRRLKWWLKKSTIKNLILELINLLPIQFQDQLSNLFTRKWLNITSPEDKNSSACLSLLQSKTRDLFLSTREIKTMLSLQIEGTLSLTVLELLHSKQTSFLGKWEQTCIKKWLKRKNMRES